jgi:parallel beta-helix repeat protein
MRSRFAVIFTVIWGTVAAAPAGAATYYASPNGADTNPGTMFRPWKTLQAGKKSLKPGDALLLADGQYPGGVRQSGDGLPGKPITFRAINPGRAVIRGDWSAERDAFFIYESDWITVDGLVLQSAQRVGIYVSGSNHVTVQNCTMRNNGVAGMLTGYCDDLLIQNNEAAYNREQHGIYISNGGDRPVLRDNVCHDNGRCGIQLNGDGKMVRPQLGARGDGIIANALLDGNIAYNNGLMGGAAINLLSVRYSRISNNLVFNNLAGGISLWNDNRKTALQWGSKNNLIAYNTIYFRPTEGRWCLSFTNGCTDNLVANNILAGGARGAYQFDLTSSFSADHNLLFSYNCKFAAVNESTGKMLSLKDYLSFTRNDGRSVVIEPRFVNPAGRVPDFHLRANSLARRAGVFLQQVKIDADGNTIGALPNIGCYGGAPAAGDMRTASANEQTEGEE